MLKSIKVRDYMTRRLVTFRSDTDLFTAINRLLEHRISGAPVVDSQGHLIGLLSESDCLRGILSGAYYEAIGGTVSSYMTTQVETVTPEADIIELSERFLRGRRRRMPAASAVSLMFAVIQVNSSFFDQALVLAASQLAGSTSSSN